MLLVDASMHRFYDSKSASVSLQTRCTGYRSNFWSRPTMCGYRVIISLGGNIIVKHIQWLIEIIVHPYLAFGASKAGSQCGFAPLFFFLQEHYANTGSELILIFLGNLNGSVFWGGLKFNGFHKAASLVD